MITDYFSVKEKKTCSSKNTEYYEIHRAFIERNKYKVLYDEIKYKLVQNSTRQSCVCINEDIRDKFTIYNLPLIDWTNTAFDICNKLPDKIDYGLVHYYYDYKSTINWHSDREALRSNIYLVSIGGTRRFCLRNKTTKEITTIDLYDGDLLIMKVGCQEKYEHCIKSVKEFNQPRISITFRQLESSLCYFTYDQLNRVVNISSEPPNTDNYIQITKTRQNIIIGYLNNGDNSTIFKDFGPNTRECVSILKSNIQKAVRRKETEVALASTMKMIIDGQAVELLRRLTIISFEDVQLSKYYPIIVWYYIALTCEYQLSENDVTFIYSYVKLLCIINTAYDISKAGKNTMLAYELGQLIHNNNAVCISLYLRIQYGGFGGEISLMNYLINSIIDDKLDICYDEMEMDKYKLPDGPPIILDCAIDFHCFPKMPEKVLAKIDAAEGLTEADVRNYIWHHDSNINVRCEQVVLNSEKWNTVIKPKCDNYRYCIRKLINL